MAAVFQISDEGVLALLAASVTNVVIPGSVALFTNNFTPVPSMIPGSFTEATWTGYSRASSVPWTTPALTGDIAYSDSGTLTFTVTSGGTGNTCYGYFVMNDVNSHVIFAERFDVPITVVDGVAIVITIRFRFRNP